MRDAAILVIVVVVVLLVTYIFLASRRGIGMSTQTPPGDPYAAQRAAEAERRQRNQQPYELDQIPANADKLTLLRFSFDYRDELYAMVYLLPGHEPKPTTYNSRVDLYIHFSPMHTRAIWAWRGDHLYDKMTFEQLWAEEDRRHQQMLDLLQSAGWRVSDQHYPAGDIVRDLVLTYLTKG